MATAQMTSPLAVLGRITWMIAGPIALAGLTFFILDRGTGWVTGADIAYFVVVAAMVGGRWLEFRYGTPQTAMGEPATTTHLYRYTLAAPLIALGVWVIANVIGNHWLPGL
jgi:hypothetical protein